MCSSMRILVRCYTIFWVYDLYTTQHYMNGDVGRPLYTAAAAVESFHIAEAFNLTTVYLLNNNISMRNTSKRQAPEL